MCYPKASWFRMCFAMSACLRVEEKKLRLCRVVVDEPGTRFNADIQALNELNCT